MRYLLLIFSLSIASMSYATTIYTQTDQNQNTTYSDTPLSGEGVSHVETLSTPALSNSPSNTSTPSTSTDEVKKPYTQFSITSPTDQQTFQNQRTITIEVKIEPDLQKGDKLKAYVDGAPYGKESSSNKIDLEQINRGAHQIYVVLMDSNNTILKKSNTVTVFIHYASIIR